MTRVVLALGSNLGDRIGNLRRAVAGLRDSGVSIARSSSAWETPPFPADQPAFLNAAVSGETTLAAYDLLRVAKELESQAGRRPNRRWGPRPLDIDILFIGAGRVDTADLVIPHPRIAERAFVLLPLAEAWPGTLPVIGARALDLLQGTSIPGTRRTGALLDEGGLEFGQ